MKDSFQTKSHLSVNHQSYQIFSLSKLQETFNIEKLPFALKVLLENLLRFEDGETVTREQIEAIATWQPTALKEQEIAFSPSRVILQDFTGVPAIVDLAAMRDAMRQIGQDPRSINPLSPVELVIDHSVMVDKFGSPVALRQNTELEFERNQERYHFLKWGQQAFSNFKVVPPGTGIVHQVNLEYLARVVFAEKQDNSKEILAYPDTLVGTDSHTTMINALGVLGWGVGGIEAEAAMLGQPVTMLIPDVIGFKLTGQLPEGTTATDLVLRVVEMLRQKGVVGKFVEFFGDGLDHLPLADRATIANMAPEYGATCGIFPVDQETLNFLTLTGRDEAQIQLIEAYAKSQGLFRTPGCTEAHYSDTLSLNLGDIEPSIAGPKRPQDRIALKNTQSAYRQLQTTLGGAQSPKSIQLDGKSCELKDGVVVIAAITSCTNTSNPDVMIAAGLVAQKAIQKGLRTQPWVKTSLSPGSQVVTDYLNAAQLTQPLEALGFHLVGYGCMTCIGNSGPLATPLTEAIQSSDLPVCAVLSGNRNFEGRIHPLVKNAYLASPPLVVAYALAGTMDIDLYQDPIGQDPSGTPVYLKDIWPTQEEIHTVTRSHLTATMFRERYQAVYQGNQAWLELQAPTGDAFIWDHTSTYVKSPPYFERFTMSPDPVDNINNAHVLAMLGDSVTTDHISPAGSIAKDSPAGQYLLEHGVKPEDFNSYGSRRGNHEVMMRGTFANIRLKNQLAPGTEGSWTIYFPSKQKMTIYDASMKYQANEIPLIIIAGKEYGTGSSRDWAAKGTRLLGVKAVIAESFERIHRSNLIGMGVLPLQFKEGENCQTYNIKGYETFSIQIEKLSPRSFIKVTAKDSNHEISFDVLARIDTPKELAYFEHGGILHFVLRQLAKKGNTI